MQTEHKKALVLHLIEADLISRKLVFTLRRGGVDAENYLTGLSTIIFNLMDIPSGDDDLYAAYETLTEQVESINTEHGHQVLQPLVQRVYVFLEEYGG